MLYERKRFPRNIFPLNLHTLFELLIQNYCNDYIHSLIFSGGLRGAMLT